MYINKATLCRKCTKQSKKKLLIWLTEDFFFFGGGGGGEEFVWFVCVGY